MAQFKGTPGPWEFNGISAVIAKDTTVVIGNFFGTVLPTRDDPDWKLIAAAPELLEALQELLNKHGSMGDAHVWSINESPEGVKARSAINKATGETK